MNVTLVSQDRLFYDLCSSVLQDLSVGSLKLEAPGSAHKPADLTVWDFSTAPFSEDGVLAGACGDLFVFSRGAAAEAKKLLPPGALGVLIKPVKRPALRAFLSAALNRLESRDREAPCEAKEELLQALLEANLELQESDQDRTNFLARALHDFRAPLTALHGYCEMLLQQAAGPLEQDQMDLLQRMQHSVGRLTRMTSAMLEQSIRHNVKRKPNLLKSNIDTCIHNSVHQIMPLALEKDISVSVDLDPPDAHFHFDAGPIEQVLVNLLENAVKFTGRNGTIEIRGRLTTCESPGTQEDDAEGRLIPVYRFEIRDNGMGILPEHVDSVFEEYTSYAGARDRSGGGLGLAICRMIVSEHKGAILAESDRHGTTMHFWLPAQQGLARPQIKAAELEWSARAS